MKSGHLYVISGPAGAGKSLIVNTLINKHPDIKKSISCATRDVRPGEVHGVDYYFMDPDVFDEKVKNGEFYEHAHVHSGNYGTLKSVVYENLNNGDDLILEIDVQGCMQAKENDPDLVTSIFICPPSMDNLEKRLRDRNTETEAQLNTRLHNSHSEVLTAKKYDYVIVHEDWAINPNALDDAVENVYSIIKVKHMESKNNAEFLDELARESEKWEDL